MTDEKIVVVLASRFSWPGADREDVEQEAWFALERCRPKWNPALKDWPGFAWMCVKNHLTELTRRECYRRPQCVVLSPALPYFEDVVERVDARRRLRLILELPLPPRERAALNGAFVGKAIGREARTEHMARYRAKRKLLTAAA